MHSESRVKMNDISESALIGEGVTFGSFCVVEAGVQIGADSEIGHHVVIRSGTKIGAGVRIDDHTSIGKLPMKALNSAVTRAGDFNPCTVGDKTIVGSSVVIYAGSRIDTGVLIADFASVRERVSIGRNTIVGRGVSIENDCSIGAFCKLETNVYISAYSELEDYVFIGPGVLTSNDNYVGRNEERLKHFKGVTVRRGGRVGVGAVLLPGLEIHEDALAAAGSVVTRDVPGRQIHAGVPAKLFGNVSEDQLLENQTWFESEKE